MEFNIPSQEAIDKGLFSDLVCYRVYLPEGAEYRAILGGLLWQLARGRTWNAKTGSVRDAQRVGYRIFEASYPLLGCGEASSNSDCDDCDGGEELSGQVVTDVQIVNGKIRVFFGPCCYRDIGSGSQLVDTSDKTQDLPEVFKPDSSPYDVSCQKAYTVARALFTMADLLCSTPGGFPPSVYHYIENAYPSVDFDKSALLQAYGVWLTSGTSIDFGLNTSDFKRYVCALKTRMDGATWGISASEYNAADGLLSGAMSAAKAAILRSVVQAARQSTFNTIALGASADSSEYNCDCPSSIGETVQSSAGWYLGNWSQEMSLSIGAEAGFFDFAEIHGQVLAQDAYGWALMVTGRVSGRAKGASHGDAGVSDGSGPMVKNGVVYATTPGLIQMNCHPTAYANLAAANPTVGFSNPNTQDVASDEYGITINEPRKLKGAIVNYAFSNQWEEATSIQFRVAPLFNVNSPSHA